MISIIQAIALDMLWSQAVTSFVFEDVSTILVVSWLQSLATLLLLIVVWMTFVGLLMRFVWTPSLSDTALPFIVGLLQFAVIEASTPGRFGFWLVGLGVLSLVMSLLVQRYFKRARANPNNEEFFKMVAPATWRDFLPTTLSAGYALLAGIIALNVAFAPWLQIALIFPLIAGLIYLVFDQNKFWVMSIPTFPDVADDHTSEVGES